MDLAKIRRSFSQLDEGEQRDLIEEIRARRRNNLLAVKARRTSAAKAPSAKKHQKEANFALTNLSPQQAADLLALLGEELSK